MLFRRRSEPPAPPPTDVPLPSSGVGAPSEPVRFLVSAVVEVFGIGVIAAGNVKSGILRKGVTLQAERGGTRLSPPLNVQVTKIMVHLAHRVELYRGQYDKSLDEVGPGYQAGVQLKGVTRTDLRVGDYLVE